MYCIITIFSTMINCSTSFIFCFALASNFASAKLCWKLEIQKLIGKNCDGGAIDDCDLQYQVKTDHFWPLVSLSDDTDSYNSSDHRLTVSQVDEYGYLPQQLSITFYDVEPIFDHTRICVIGPVTINNKQFRHSSSCISEDTNPTIVNVSFKGVARDCSGSILNLSKEQLVVISVIAAIVVLLSVLCCLGLCLRKYYSKQPALIDKPKEFVPPTTEPPNIFIPQILSSSQSKKKTTSTSEHVDKRSIIPNQALTTTVSVYPKLSMQQPSTKASKVNQPKPELPAIQEKENDCNLQDIFFADELSLSDGPVLESVHWSTTKWHILDVLATRRVVIRTAVRMYSNGKRGQSKKKTTSTSEHVDKRSIIPNPALTTTVSVYPKLSIPSTKASKVNQTKPELPAIQKKENVCYLQDIFKFNCYICAVSFTSYEQVEAHVQTKEHLRKINDFNAGLIPEEPKKKEVKSFVCELCDKTMNTIDQYDFQIQGKKHLSKVRQQEREEEYYCEREEDNEYYDDSNFASGGSAVVADTSLTAAPIPATVAVVGPQQPLVTFSTSYQQSYYDSNWYAAYAASYNSYAAYAASAGSNYYTAAPGYSGYTYQGNYAPYPPATAPATTKSA